MRNVMEKTVCEQATGCQQVGSIIFYDDKGNKISVKEAKKIIQDYGIVEVPQAGAGSFREVFDSLGFEEAEIVDSTSSAGDWGLGVKNEVGWFPAWQENRYPYNGFRYSINDSICPCRTFKQLCIEMEEA